MGYNLLAMSISTSNHMLGSEIWDKLPKSVFENTEIAQVKHFKIFKNYKGDFSSKLLESNVIKHESNQHFGLKLISFNSSQLQISKWAIRKQLVITK